MNVEKLSGLESMRGVLEDKTPHAPIADIVSMKGMEVASGYIKFSAKADKRHINQLGGVHGGFAALV